MTLTAEQFAFLVDEVISNSSVVFNPRGLAEAVRRRLEAMHVTEIEKPPTMSQIQQYFIPIDWQTEYREWRTPHAGPAPPGTQRWDPSMSYSNQLMHGLEVLSSNPFAALHFVLNHGVRGTEVREAMRRAEVVGQVYDILVTGPSLGPERYPTGTVVGTGAGVSVHGSPVPPLPPRRPIVFSAQHSVPRFASQARHAFEARQRVQQGRSVAGGTRRGY